MTDPEDWEFDEPMILANNLFEDYDQDDEFLQNAQKFRTLGGGNQIRAPNRGWDGVPKPLPEPEDTREFRLNQTNYRRQIEDLVSDIGKHIPEELRDRLEDLEDEEGFNFEQLNQLRIVPDRRELKRQQRLPSFLENSRATPGTKKTVKRNRTRLSTQVHQHRPSLVRPNRAPATSSYKRTTRPTKPNLREVVGKVVANERNQYIPSVNPMGDLGQVREMIRSVIREEIQGLRKQPVVEQADPLYPVYQTHTQSLHPSLDVQLSATQKRPFSTPVFAKTGQDANFDPRKEVSFREKRYVVSESPYSSQINTGDFKVTGTKPVVRDPKPRINPRFAC